MADQKQQAKKITVDQEAFDNSGNPLPAVAGLPVPAVAGLPEGKTTPASWPEFPKIIGDGIAQVMRARTNMQQVEKLLDAWRLCATPEEIKTAKEQMVSAKLAMESLGMRFGQMTA